MASFEYCPPDFELSEKASVVAANFVIASVFFFSKLLFEIKKRLSTFDHNTFLRQRHK